jgi:nucleoside-diphosphate-sugar epimerase
MSMRVFVAGATGAIGRRLIYRLVQSGHVVAGMTRTENKAPLLRVLGADPIVVDAFDTDGVVKAIREFRPEVIVNELTAIPGRLNIRKFDEEFTLTNQLRMEGTDNLIAGAREVGVTRFISQSYAAWPYVRQGSMVKSEDDPFDPNPPIELRNTMEALQYLESVTRGLQGVKGIVLRYGAFYGPGTSLSEGGSLVEDVKRRKFPIIGKGSGMWSFIHIDDAAAATVAAVEHGAAGVYNIVDDDPAPVSEWLPALAEALGAPKPLHVPAFIARFLVGEQGIMMMTQIRGASNAKAKRRLQWNPQWPSWRSGFREGLVESTARWNPPLHFAPGRV